jgi:DNA replicative helicase MCM subunit Mcm2 (Cdc46/Mcm family)
MKMRELGSYKNTISATPRQLESVIRLAEARARLRFSKYVEKEDVDENLLISTKSIIFHIKQASFVT